MRASFLTAVLLALSGASTLAHAAPGLQAPAAVESACSGACVISHGAPKALAVSTAADPGAIALIELERKLDELTIATKAARQDEEEKRAEAERAAAVLRALETDLSRVEALLVESMAERRGVDEKPVLQGIGYAGDAPTDGPAGAVRLRLVDLSDSGEPVLVPVDVREPAPAADDRGFMGVSVRDGDDGVTISSVLDGSPAEAAGLQAEDVLFNIGGSSVVDMDGLVEAMSAYAAGETVAVGIMRGKKPMRRRVTLGSRSVTGDAAPSTAVRTESAPIVLHRDSDEIILMVEAEGPRRDLARRIRLIRPDDEGWGEIIDREIEIEWVEHEEEECCGECDENEHEDDCCGECDDHEDEDCCGECHDHGDDDCCGECDGHEDEDCCGECHDHGDDDCCGECDDHEDEDCCGECHDHGDDDCCGECDDHEDEDCCGECGDHEDEDCCGECHDHEDDHCCGECGEHDHGDCCGECHDSHGHEGGHDPLPEGYEEIYERRETRSVHDGHEKEEVVTRRERRPVRHEGHDRHEDHGHHEWLDRDEEHGHHEGHDRHEGVGREIEELHQRIERLEREIEELTEALIDVRRAMDRRGRR